MDQFVIINAQELEALIELAISKALFGLMGKSENAKGIMNAKEAAEFLNISLSTLYAKTSKRIIPHTKQEGLYFKCVELIAWLAQAKKTYPG